ncbi:hypothetical protein HK101_009517 [Irineochytrium annulatum]|nr:hypothetical protein HK101_009517 [Irineochytrium annulatum]
MSRRLEDKPMKLDIFQELSISIWKKTCLLLSLHTEDVTRSLIRLFSRIVSPKRALAPIVYIMDEGFSAWQNAKFPVTTDVPVQIPSSFEVNVQPQMLASVQDVQQASVTGSAVLIDSRDARRYAGLEEPIDAKAGHIPGALNYFWKDVLDWDGRWTDTGVLEERFSKLDKDGAIIVYCGSGVSACPNVIALEEAGYTNVKLYSGSWSDWISYDENPVAIGDAEADKDV